jgi:uncharacterized protein (TIGR04255 family)
MSTCPKLEPMNTGTPHNTPQEVRRPSGLPDFDRPPVNEVILSIQFAALEKMKSAHIGLLWARFRAQYPDAREQGTINAVFETFGTPSQPERIRFEQFLSPPMPRYWFEKSGTPDLLQVQQDRIIHNWRKHEDQPIYPRYETLRDRFNTEVNQFVSFLDDEKIGELRPNQCEVTYTNIIELPGSERVHDRLEKITTLWTGHLSEKLDAELEDASAQLRFKLLEAGKPVGRVHISFQPAVLQSDPSKEVIKLDITARGRPKHETRESAFDFLDLGRRAVVKTFAAVTTPSMHSMWGRTDDNS